MFYFWDALQFFTDGHLQKRQMKMTEVWIDYIYVKTEDMKGKKVDLHISRGSHGLPRENVDGHRIPHYSNNDHKRNKDILDPEAARVAESQIPGDVSRPSTPFPVHIALIWE